MEGICVEEQLPDKSQLTAVTLAMIAGGLGTRMGKPKAWLQVGGKSILALMLDNLQWPGPTMLVIAPAVASPPDRERFDRCVSDPVDGIGPLRGVLTALEHATTPIVAAIAVDMPAVEQSHLAWLAASLRSDENRLGVMSLSGENGEQHVEPFPAAYRVQAAPILASHLENGQRSVHRLCRDARFIAIPAPADWRPDVWTNLNDPAQFAAFEKGLTEPLRETTP